MSENFTFWTHGVSVVPEYTKEYTGHDLNLYMRRAGWGTQIRQARGTSNWFHFAIPSATKLDNDDVDRYHAWLRGSINNHAIITRVRFHEASSRRNAPVVFDSGPLNIIGRELDEDYNLPDRISVGPLVMSVNVEFRGTATEFGEVLFTGAGTRFEERT